MAKFDDALVKLNKAFRYQGNPPSNETEYDAMKSNITDAPTWTEVENVMDNIIDPEDLKASAKAKLIAGEALTEDEANVMIGG
jgi:hypothetical protein|tara:strand:- start:123 stop:371 length:249 start_codon:yes stop_codon:yes gene_type:complete